MNIFLKNNLNLLEKFIASILILVFGYYFCYLILTITDPTPFSGATKTFNLSMSIMEEPKSKNKNAFYAQVLLFSMLVVGIGYIFFQVYKKVSSGDFASAPNADILQLIQKSIGEWSVQGVDVEKVHKALY